MKDTNIDQFLQTLKGQIELTCKIHKCKFDKMPEPLWNITLGAALNQNNLDFTKNKQLRSVNAHTF